MLQEILQNGIPEVILWVLVGLVLVYTLAEFTMQLSPGTLFWQNLSRSNRVQLPELAKTSRVSGSGAGEEQTQALVMLPEEGIGPSERGSIIYPALGRNGLNFKPELCTSCGLCVFVCPVEAIGTPATKEGYTRRFDLRRCVFCGLCEGACPTQAIRLTVEPHPARVEMGELVVSGEMAYEKCPTCGAKPPSPNLLSARIYEKGFVNEPKKKRGKKNKSDSCEECVRRITEAEETICE
jgi:formate hydrogenlyase subunit 6/NADH:ubiquinone oxidoreductase subunit I